MQILSPDVLSTTSKLLITLLLANLYSRPNFVPEFVDSLIAFLVHIVGAGVIHLFEDIQGEILT